MLEVSQLTRCYGNFTAVDNVSFTIGGGEIVGLLGHNGAGKTTIMKVLSGFLEPNQGQIRINGLDLEIKLKKIQQNLGYLPENLPIYPEMVVADYLDYAAELKGLGGDIKHQEIKRVIQATAINDKLLAPVGTLSRGFKQRVGVAQAILGKPKLLILDEPANGLDPTQTEHMRQLIRDIAKEATVILSTHIMQEVDALCDRVLILRGGQLAVDAKLAELRQSNRLLLSTSMTPGVVRECLQDFQGVKQFEQLQERQQSTGQQTGYRYRYRLTLTAKQEMNEVGAALANVIVTSGADLYSLQQEHRDLESLFREVNDAPANTDLRVRQEGLNYAA